MVPTDCLMIQEPLVTRGMSLKVLLRRVCASLLSPPARNLPTHPACSPQGKNPIFSASFSPNPLELSALLMVRRRVELHPAPAKTLKGYCVRCCLLLWGLRRSAGTRHLSAQREEEG